MSQSRARKPSALVNGAGARSREMKDSNRVTNASGDTANGQKVKGDKPSQRGKSSNKVPKSMRYDLENALVGLCDIWFEEIKPHLVKNKIKLHVHGGSSGDHEDSPMPPGAPGCSHLDPATSSARCKLCQLLLNASSSIQSAVSQAAFAVPVACSSANNRDFSVNL